MKECGHVQKIGLCPCHEDDMIRCDICGLCMRCGGLACTLEETMILTNQALKWADEIIKNKEDD